MGGFPRAALRLPGAILVSSLRDGHLRCGGRSLSARSGVVDGVRASV
jgi:hypothetical protein